MALEELKLCLIMDYGGIQGQWSLKAFPKDNHNHQPHRQMEDVEYQRHFRLLEEIHSVSFGCSHEKCPNLYQMKKES